MGKLRDHGPRHRFDWESHETSDEQRERELKRSQDENRRLRAEVERLQGALRTAERVLRPYSGEQGKQQSIRPHRSTTAWGRAR